MNEREFTDDDVERAARVLAEIDGVHASSWRPLREPIKGKYRSQARAVVAALKGDENE